MLAILVLLFAQKQLVQVAGLWAALGLGVQFQFVGFVGLATWELAVFQELQNCLLGIWQGRLAVLGTLVGQVRHLLHHVAEAVGAQLVLPVAAALLGLLGGDCLDPWRVKLAPLGNWLVDLLNSPLILF